MMARAADPLWSPADAFSGYVAAALNPQPEGSTEVVELAGRGRS